MKLKNSSLDKAIKISIMAGILLVSLAFAYYLAIFLPQKEQRKIELQKQEQKAEQKQQQLNRIFLDACLSNAQKTYEENWADEAKLLGKAEDAPLPAYKADKLSEYLKELKDECFKKYPQ